MSRFVQLTTEDCTYLLDLIEDMDSETTYTARQRAYTVPKLQQIQADPRAARLTRKDVEYLLELVADDDLIDCEQQRLMTSAALQEILDLQIQNQREQQSRDNERWTRRLKRSSQNVSEVLAEHFEETAHLSA